MSAAADPPEEPEYVFWYHTGEGSVCFYPPGSIQEHLVTEHGIDSLDVLRHANGHHDHARDHSEQAGLPMGAVGDLPAVGHAHEEPREPHTWPWSVRSSIDAMQGRSECWTPSLHLTAPVSPSSAWRCRKAAG